MLKNSLKALMLATVASFAFAGCSFADDDDHDDHRGGYEHDDHDDHDDDDDHRGRDHDDDDDDHYEDDDHDDDHGRRIMQNCTDNLVFDVVQGLCVLPEDVTATTGSNGLLGAGASVSATVN